MRALRFAFDEALASLWRGGRTAAWSLVSIATSLLVLGGFLLGVVNLERLAGQWLQAAEFSVYLAQSATIEQRNVVERLLEQSRAVAAREYVTQSEAARRFTRDFPDLADVAGVLEDNPLPSSFEVRLLPGEEVANEAQALVARLRAVPGVADVRYDRQWISRVFTTIGAVRGVGIGLATMLSLAAALTVASVIRLGLAARSDEIEIMKLVGAPFTYIRGPFVAEGLVQGGLGGLVALAALGAAYGIVRTRLAGAAGGVLDSASLSFLPWQLCLVLVSGGLAVGCLGGWLASRSARPTRAPR
jgi:cell division transport system permease protein